MNVPVYLVTLFLHNQYNNFDVTLHVAQAYIEEGFKIVSSSHYP